MFKHILVALDGSECSQDALKTAVGLAKELGADCTIVSVVDVVAAAAPMTFASGEIVDQWIKTLTDGAQHTIAEATKLYTNSGVQLKNSVVEGYPAEAIIDVAKKNGADLIVTGSHGRSGVRRMWLGSVAESVVRTAHIPVLVVRS